MFFRDVFLVVSLMNSLRSFHVSSCDENCADKPVFSPSRVVVKYGDPTSATCYVCNSTCHNNLFNLEKSVGVQTQNGTTLLWTVDSMTEWDTSTMCYYNTDSGHQCCSTLPVTVYQPPENVSITFVNHTGPMFERAKYTLQCSVQNVAPVEQLTVAFYRGQTVLGRRRSTSNPQKTPVTESFTLNLNASKEDDGAQYWCEAKLELGPEGPQLPPLVTSEKLTATVYYEPQLQGPTNPDPIKITKGDTLQLNCSAVGNPSPLYTWTLPPAIASSYDGSVLTVQSAGFEHRGQYSCKASSVAGTVSVNFSVDVQEDITPYIVLGSILAVSVILALVVMAYIHHYKHNRMGHYSFKGVTRSLCI